MTDKTPIKMLHDRVMVELDRDAGERRSSGGIVIPATAAMGACVLGMMAVPLGTMVNGFILYVVFSEKGKYVLSPEYKEVIRMTAHNTE